MSLKRKETYSDRRISMEFKNAVAMKVAEATGLDVADVSRLVEIPPQEDMGDFAFPCFTLAKTMHKAPNMIASELSGSDKLAADWLSKVEAKGPYLNFFVDRGAYAREIPRSWKREPTMAGLRKVRERLSSSSIPLRILPSLST